MTEKSSKVKFTGRGQRLLQLLFGLLALLPDTAPVLQLPLTLQLQHRLVERAEVLQRKLCGLAVIVLQDLQHSGGYTARVSIQPQLTEILLTVQHPVLRLWDTRFNTLSEEAFLIALAAY